jgi:cyclic-di-AMP phosphodiesterase PgpH
VNLSQQLDRVAAADAPNEGALFHARRLGLALLLAVVTYLLFPSSPVVEFPLHEVGSVAPDNVIAPAAYTVRKPSAELSKEREDAARAASPILVETPAALDTARAALRSLSAALQRARQTPGGDAERLAAVQRAAAAFAIQLTPDEAAYALNAQKWGALEEAVAQAQDRWLARGVLANAVADELRGTATLRRSESDARVVRLDTIPTFSVYVARARALQPDQPTPVAGSVYIKLLSAFFRPTITYDRAATERLRQEARAAVSPVKFEVRKNQKIVGAHEVVGREEYEKMRALRDAMNEGVSGEGRLRRVLGAVLFNTLVISLFGITLLLFRPQLYASMRAMALIAIAWALVLVASAVISKAAVVRPELIPVALAAIIFSALFDPRISIVGTMILATLIGGQAVFRGTNALFINLIGGVAAAFSVGVIRRRNQVLYSMALVASAYLLAALAIGLTLDQPWRELLRSGGLGALNAAISVALAMILLPLAEELSGIDTYFRLLEWSDLNRPLMQRMSLEAPGTFDHTIRIANLVEPACNAIGANGLLGRVGAYYHDIGKLKKPQYFVENQPRGRNPHDKLKPSTSASIIRNHVKDGMELAAEYRLPKSVAAFIPEHHGTANITYFLEKAKERDGPPQNPAEFAYPGPLPQSAETAITMLADGVEAATRVLNDPTPQKIRDVIEHIVRQRIESGQLREAPLTLRQLEIVKQEFARVLTAMYHSRIDYPAAAGGVSAEFASTGSERR